MSFDKTKITSVGFTGTRLGMTHQQKLTVRHLLLIEFPNVKVVHHGDCVGADDEFDDIARELGFEIQCHPPIENKNRAFVDDKGDTVMHPVDEYINRDRRIVNKCQVLFVAPKENTEVVRSGTWTTLRYAWKVQKPFVLIMPDGITASGG